MKKKFNVLLLIPFLVAWAHIAHARIYVDITSPGMTKIPIAVPYLNVTPQTIEYEQLGRKISEILSNDLTFHDFFSVLDPAQYGGRADADWSKFRIDYLVKGAVTASGNAIVVDFQLIDMSNNSEMVSRHYTGRIIDYRWIAHRFCDEIIMAITGEHGVSLSKITFVGPNGRFRDVYTADFDGADAKVVTNERSLVVSPRYSPDGKYIAYTSYRYGKPQIFIKDLATGVTKRIAAYRGLNISPAWAPDGRRLAVTLSKDGNPDIYIIDISGKVLERLTNGPGINVSPSWSPDGARLAFVSDREGKPQIYIYDMITKTIKRITYNGNYNTDPQWSPRGDKIVYASRIGGQFQIMTIAPDGGEPTQLTTVGDNENPSWSPNGRMIIFSSNRLGGKAIFVMQANGADQRVVVRRFGNLTMPNWGPNDLSGSK
ncbi:MAG: Tol-Pal system beta propeller repeat protein TolB [Dissulfurimicrobium sp.]|uniref:Tol-Pal system beta propeller repeat protein TolB n=1 Tax=Dissulfurimicrobium sp. TaxID=2022436 RepID=UPI003D0F7E94